MSEVIESTMEGFSTSFHNSADTEFTRKQMLKSLTYNLNRKYSQGRSQGEVEALADNIMSTHGLRGRNFNTLGVVQELIEGEINAVSIDDNSNKEEKTVNGLFAEANNPNKKLVGYDYLYRVMKELYGKERAKRLIGEMLDYSLGLSDSSNILLNYCWATDATKLTVTGRDFGMLQSSQSNRVGSYISALCETIHQMSSHLAGAIALGTLFFDVAKLAIYKMDIPFSDLPDKSVRKLFESEFQQFVHSVNFLSRNASESPFTNISIFGKGKLKYILENDFDWYFPNETNGSDGEWVDYCVEYITELQNIFLDFFDKGDPMSNGLPYRFPVVTINIAKDSDGNIIDTELVDDICERDVYRYNIFTSEGTKCASCCRLLSSSEMLEVAGQSNSFGGGALASLGSHRVCTINFNRIALEATDEEDFWRILEYRMEGARDVLIAHKRLINIFTDAGLQSFVTNGWINMDRMFSTVGVLGIYECGETMFSKFGLESDEFKGLVLMHLDKTVSRYTMENKGITMNIEQIPAESFAVRLAKTDRLLFSEEEVPYELYANQFLPLWKEATIWERLAIDGRYNQLLTGGGIASVTIGERVSPAQARSIIEYAVKVGSEHFALNAVYSQCENGHTSFGDLDTCGVCGGEIKEKLTRVVGFFTKVSSWNPTRRDWEFPRRTKVDLS